MPLLSITDLTGSRRGRRVSGEGVKHQKLHRDENMKERERASLTELLGKLKNEESEEKGTESWQD
ncbi:uncharacterized protein G2W53_018999 [Senna tora]|uniref:Uncharacterized protein n=1 Tax=Senna tora TaxID=362788 RepID=A0A834TSU8_9FABA|nr:uncharacterized protein G2W53_018999 [Senna tora]